MSNAAGFAALDEMVRRCRAVPGLAREAAPAVAKAAGDWLRGELQAGRDPATGTPWPAKKDGGRALENAAANLRVAVVGTTIVLSIGAPEVFHHFGAQGKPRRGQLPAGSMPKRLGDAIRLGFVTPFRNTMSGGK